MASAASTTPGSVATLASCSSERSCSIAASSSASAKTRAGTRMPGTVPTGISHSSSSMRRASNIEDHAGNVLLAGGLEGQAVIRDGLDQRWWRAEHPRDGGAQAVVVQVE